MATRTRGSTANGTSRSASSRTSPEPTLAPLGREIQRFGTLRLLPIALSAEARAESCQLLNEILADTMMLYAMYKKHHWLVAGPTFYQLHLLFDKHAEEQLELIDLAGRAGPEPGRHRGRRSAPRRGADDDRPPAQRRRGRPGDDPSPARTPTRTIIEKVRAAIDKTEKNEDWGSNDMLMGDVLRRHELQVWFVAEHVVDTPLIES